MLSKIQSQQRKHRGKCQGISKKTIVGLLPFVLTELVHTQEDGYDPRGTTCGLTRGQVTTVDNTLYVDGGNLLDQYFWRNSTEIPDNGIAGGTDYTRWQNEHLWMLALDKSFDVAKPPWEVESKPASHFSHYNGLDGTLWNTGDGSFFTVGGGMSYYHGPAPGRTFDRLPIWDSQTRTYNLPEGRLFKYNTTSKEWSTVGTLADAKVKRVLNNAHAVVLKPKKLGFNIGGMLTDRGEILANMSSNSWEKGNMMQIYDVEENKWEEVELPKALGYLSYANAHAIEELGKGGVVVLFSGISATSPRGVPVEYRSFKDIWIYDIAKREWYSQLASGEIPPYRYDTCSVLVPAPDGSSYQIYAFSGLKPGGLDSLLDFHVLTMPGFVWKKITLKNYPDSYVMRWHSCSVYKNRQMIIVNGEYGNPKRAIKNATLTCEPGVPVKVFDMGKWEFVSKFDPTVSENMVPDGIVKIVGGNSKGGATLKEPKVGWETKGLMETFETRNNGTSGAENENSDDGNDSDGKPNNNKKAPVVVIVGSAVGGVIGIAILIGLIVFLRRRKRSATANGAEFQGDTPNPNGYTSGQFQSSTYVDYYAPGGEYEQRLAELSATRALQEMSAIGVTAELASSELQYIYPKQEHVQQILHAEVPPPPFEETSPQGQPPPTTPLPMIVNHPR